MTNPDTQAARIREALRIVGEDLLELSEQDDDVLSGMLHSRRMLDRIVQAQLKLRLGDDPKGLLDFLDEDG